MKIKTLSLILVYHFIGFQSTAQSLTVMSYNIHHGADKDEKDKLKEIGLLIKNAGVDLVGLQEVDSVCTRSGQQDQMKILSEITGMHYAFVRHFAYQGGAYGQGILSKYPIKAITNTRLTLLKPDTLRSSLAMISAEVDLPVNHDIVFASAHYSLDEATRLVQAEETLSFTNKQKLPVIFTGDLNAVPGAKEIKVLDKLFSLTNDNGILTFPSDKPVKAIDYIYVTTKDLNKVAGIKAPMVLYSDHLPLITNFSLHTNTNN